MNKTTPIWRNWEDFEAASSKSQNSNSNFRNSFIALQQKPTVQTYSFTSKEKSLRVFDASILLDNERRFLCSSARLVRIGYSMRKELYILYLRPLPLPPRPLPRPPRPLPPLDLDCVLSEPWWTRDISWKTGSVGKKQEYFVSPPSRGVSEALNVTFILWQPNTSSFSFIIVTLSTHFGKWIMVASLVDTSLHLGPKCGSMIKTPSLSGSGLT